MTRLCRTSVLRCYSGAQPIVLIQPVGSDLFPAAAAVYCFWAHCTLPAQQVNSRQFHMFSPHKWLLSGSRKVHITDALSCCLPCPHVATTMWLAVRKKLRNDVSWYDVCWLCCGLSKVKKKSVFRECSNTFVIHTTSTTFICLWKISRS